MTKWKVKIVEFLRWAERYTKTDMVYLAKGGFWLGSGQVLSSVATFILAIAFANLLSKETYGTYRLVLSIVGILTIPTLSGMGAAVTRAVAQGYDRTIIPAFRIKLKWGALSAVASLATAGYFWYSGNLELTFAFLIATVFLPFMDTFGIYDAYLQGKKEFKKSSYYGMVIKIISVITLVTALFFSNNILVILLAYFLPNTLLRMVLYFVVVKSIEKKSALQSEAIGYGKHLSLMDIVSAIAAQVDKILLYHFLGAAEVAIYTIAIAPAEQVRSLAKNMYTLSFPKFSNKSISEIKKSIKDKFLILLLLSLALVGLYIIFAPWLFKLFFPQYLDAVFPSQIFSLFLLNIPFYLISTSLVAKKFIRAQYTVKITSQIFQIASMFILLMFFGLMGLIVARVLTRFYISFANLYFFIKGDNNNES